MVLAAGLGTRLRPLTYEIPKPMVPVLDRPVMAHIMDLLHGHHIREVIANLHHFPDSIRGYFGDELTYRFEEELLGTAGGVRNCADFLGPEPFLVISGDALTDLDLDAFARRHREAGGIATLAVKRVADTREYGVVVHDADGRVSGFQEKPDPAEALSDLGNCGIYMFNAEIFDYFPERDFVDWAQDVFPTLLDHDVPFFTYELSEYWNDVGSLEELRRGTWDALTGSLRIEIAGHELEPGKVVGEGSSVGEVALLEPPLWVGRDVRIGRDVRLQGPVAIGDAARVGDGANLRDSIVFPGTTVPDEAILIGAIAGHSGIVDSLHPRRK
ncbi:MAG TPA: NDP-sugar synthase [Solirubrobacteraceae bacterium]|nr:NDP-sugar synthase [Solirubrobacteraceae bacterium]